MQEEKYNKINKEKQEYLVTEIIDENSLRVSPELKVNLSSTDLLVLAQTGSLTFGFTTIGEIPVNGSISINLPQAGTGQGNDGFPDSAISTSTGGFDLNSVTSDDISIKGCGDNNWNLTGITQGIQPKDHTLVFQRINSICPSNSSITIEIDRNPGIVNPLPVSALSETELADKYTLTISTLDASGNEIDDIDVQIGIIGGVQITVSVGQPRMRLYGYAPSSSLVKLTGAGVGDQTQADNNGYFEFNSIFLPKPGGALEAIVNLVYPEICLQAETGTKGVTTQPTCIPPLPQEDRFYEIGPVLLSPSLIIEKGNLAKGEQVKASGKTTPNTDVIVYLARAKTGSSFFQLVKDVLAYNIPIYQIVSDEHGYYEFNLPSDSTDNWRLFTASQVLGSNSPKSNTLSFSIKPSYFNLLQLLINFLFRYWPLLLLPFILFIILLFRKRRTKNRKKDNPKIIIDPNHINLAS